MSARNSFFATAAAYVVVTFSFAYVWHAIAFRSFYDKIDYFHGGEPSAALGLATIAIQALLLACLHPPLSRGRRPFAGAARSASLFGATIASVQILAATTKNHAPMTAQWFLVEGLYFTLQFSLLAVAIAVLHRIGTSHQPR